MKITYSKSALKALKGYNAQIREYIREKINGLTETPPTGDIKPLSGYENQFRLRTGKYRVMYEYTIKDDVKTLLINKIDSRGGIYKE